MQGLQEFVDRLNGRTFKVFNTCKHWLRTVPSLPADTKKIEDIDTAAEDHLFDATRYGLMTKRARSRKPTPKKEPATRWTDEWLNNLDDIYREEEAWII